MYNICINMLWSIMWTLQQGKMDVPYTVKHFFKERVGVSFSKLRVQFLRVRYVKAMLSTTAKSTYVLLTTALS